MNEEEREIVKKFERLYLKDFNNEKITNENRLSYIECALITNLIEKLQKENETKEKIIDDMADWLYKDDTSFGYGKLKEVNTKEKIVQFFENRTKNE